MPWTLAHVDHEPPPKREVLRFRPAILDALKGYNAAQLGRDVVAGLVVGVVALPLAIAFAIASGADPRAGLVTVAVAGTLVALFGGTRVGVSGPTSSFTVVLAAIALENGLQGLLLAVLMAGVLLVLAGVFRLGTIIKLIPYPVTTGFTAGIAVTMFLSQVPDLLGILLPAGTPVQLLPKLYTLSLHIGEWHAAPLVLGATTVAVILLVQRFLPRVPGHAVALVALTLAVRVLHVDVATVGSRFSIPTGFPAPHFEVPTWHALVGLFPSALVIALLGAIESLSSAVVADGLTGQRHDSNQELMGQGIANIASPLFGGIASVGAIARTATNIQNGGKTPVAALAHAALVLAVLMFLAPWAGAIPMAVLAGILVVVAWNISQRRRVFQFFRMPRQDAAVLFVTFALTVFVNLTVAITVGLLLAAAIFMHRMTEMTHIGLVDPQKDQFPFGQNVEPQDVPPGVLIYSIDGPFFFGAADRFQETLARIDKPPKIVILRMRAVPYLDPSGLNALEMAIQGLQKRGSRVLLAGVQSQPLDMMQRSQAVHIVGDQNLFKHTKDALAAARAHLGLPETPTASAT